MALVCSGDIETSTSRKHSRSSSSFFEASLLISELLSDLEIPNHQYSTSSYHDNHGSIEQDGELPSAYRMPDQHVFNRFDVGIVLFLSISMTNINYDLMFPKFVSIHYIL